MAATISHSPRECRLALAGASGPVIIDLETTGIERSSRIVSAGILVDDHVFILFLRSEHAGIRNVAVDRFRWSLDPLANPCLILVFHNAAFDLGHLYRESITAAGTIHDTLQMLRLLDQDRGGDGAEVKTRRRYLSSGPDLNPFTSYKLKDCVPRLTGVGMIDYPGSVAALPYREHVSYLASDLIGTRALYQHLLDRLNQRPRLLDYHDRLCAPLTPLLVEMTERGMLADPRFIREETDRLNDLAARLAQQHLQTYGHPIHDNGSVARWLWGTLKLRALPGKFKRQGGRWVPSLDADHLDGLRDRHANDPRVSGSLDLIAKHRRATSLSSKLGGLLRHVGADGQVHTSLVDRQATGRISSSKPNLQQVAKTQEIAGVQAPFRPRNALVATPGFELVAMDLAQADIRVLADAVARFPLTTRKHLAKLRKDRLTELVKVDPTFGALYAMIPKCRNPQYRVERHPSPLLFDPKQGSGLARAFQDSSADFYTVAATAMLGTPPKDKKERNFCKQTILGIVNGMGPKGLAKRLECDERTAREYLEKFAATYPNEMAFRRLMVGQIASTGRVETFMGRDRTDTAHRWLVARPRVKILVSFKRSDRYWLDVSPLQPRGRVLTCFIHRAWDAHRGPNQWLKIYDAAAGGILTNRDYRLYDQTFLEFNLPIRNFAWRSIRRVRWNGEEAKYRGLDATARSLFNAICQGGTADIAKIMMLGVDPLLTKFGARLVLQIHDELVFEVPRDHVVAFIREAMSALSHPPCPGFAVPIVLEPKHGTRFGALAWRDAKAIASLRPPRSAVSRPGRPRVLPWWPAGCLI